MSKIIIDVLQIDWAELRQQKLTLVALAGDLANKGPAWDAQTKALDGIIHLVDDIQDQAVDEAGLSEEFVFGFEAV